MSELVSPGSPMSSSSRRRTPVTVVTGGPEAALLAARLGRGLATSAAPERVAVVAETIAPEPFDDVTWLAIDAVEGERSADCPCCRARVDVVRALRLLLERPRPVDRVLVLVDPSRDASVVTQTILAEPELQRLVDLDGALATVDATWLTTRLTLGMPFGGPLELQRLAIADRILVSRAADVTDEALDRVMRSVRTVNRIGEIAAPAVVPVDLGSLVDLRAWHGAPTVTPSRLHEPIVLEDDGDLPTTVWCEVEGDLDPEAVDEWFDRVIAGHGPRLLRLQGAVSVRGQDQRVCCRGVRSYAMSHSEDEHPAGRRSSRSLVVLVGHGLDAETLRHEFASTRSA